MLGNVEDAFRLLRRWGACQDLIRHHERTAALAGQLVSALELESGVCVDGRRVLLGAALHDAGMTVHPEELGGAGRKHEEAGERLLLESGLPPEVARQCRLHAQWKGTMDLEDLVVALAWALVVGFHDRKLEMRIVDAVAARIETPAWEVFARLDPIFDCLMTKGSACLHMASEPPGSSPAR